LLLSAIIEQQVDVQTGIDGLSIVRETAKGFDARVLGGTHLYQPHQAR